MSRVAFGFTVFAMVAGAAAATAQLRTGVEVAAEQTIVLAELFTSEGCSSCPPADRLLETLLTQSAGSVDVIPLSEHVDYWDHQGWKDPFGSPQFTERQKVYGFRFNVDSIYTPQLVIDGTSEFVGSDEVELKRVLAKAANHPKPLLQVAVSGAGNDTEVTISGPGLRSSIGASSDLMLALTEDGLVIDVKRGENASRTLRHSGVVRVLQSLGAIDSGIGVMTAKLAIKPEWKRDKLRVVAFVQEKKSRRILSIGWHRI